MRGLRILACGGLIGAAGCGAAEPRCLETSAPSPARAATTTAARVTKETSAKETARVPDLDVKIVPLPSPSPHVYVEIVARGSGEALRVWRLAASPNAAEPPRGTDESGEVGLAVEADGRSMRLTARREIQPPLRLAYDVGARAPAWPEAPDVALDPDRFDASLEHLVAVPDALADRELSVRLSLDLAQVGSPELGDGASSFGVGRTREMTVRGGDLARAHVIAGLVGKARFEAPEGHDEAAWLGYTAFDPRPAVADLASFRTAARQIFADLRPRPLTTLIVTDARPTGAFTASRHGSSILLRVGMGEPWSGPVRIATAVEVLHEWIGPRLWIGPPPPAPEAEAYWFTEGVTRALARDLLFRFGLLSSTEVKSEMEGLAAVLATSPLADRDNATLARMPKGALPVLVARGALYATRVDALVRKRSRNARSLANVLRELYDEAAKTKRPLSHEAWIAALVKELGDGERAAFRDAIERGKVLETPEDALGPCFWRVTRTFAAYEPGFDVDVSRAKKVVMGVVPGGPADRAGLRNGDELAELAITVGRSDVPVEAVVVRAGDKKTIRFRPAGATGRGTGWDRKPDLPETACSR